MVLIVAEHLDLGYDSKLILNDLSFQVARGDYLCIVGENGAGKSTLMKTLLGLLQPIHGNVAFGEGLKQSEIGYLPQQTQIQRDFPASVFEIVQSGCQARLGFFSFYRSIDKKLVWQNMEKMGISDLAKKSYASLSGGQQQRVLLARALCATQRILLLDEPVSGLDPNVATDMYHLIKNLNDEGITIVMISHDILAAKKYANKVLHIGTQVFFGKKDEYFESQVGKKFISAMEVGAAS